MFTKKVCAMDSRFTWLMFISVNMVCNVYFSRRATGFHRCAKLFEPNFVIRKKFSKRWLNQTNQAGNIFLTADQFAPPPPGARPLMKPLSDYESFYFKILTKKTYFASLNCCASDLTSHNRMP